MSRCAASCPSCVVNRRKCTAPNSCFPSYPTYWIAFFPARPAGLSLANGRAFGPCARFGARIPSPLDWARQIVGPLALDSKRGAVRFMRKSGHERPCSPVRDDSKMPPPTTRLAKGKTASDSGRGGGGRRNVRIRTEATLLVAHGAQREHPSVSGIPSRRGGDTISTHHPCEDTPTACNPKAQGRAAAEPPSAPWEDTTAGSVPQRGTTRRRNATDGVVKHGWCFPGAHDPSPGCAPCAATLGFGISPRCGEETWCSVPWANSPTTRITSPRCGEHTPTACNPKAQGKQSGEDAMRHPGKARQPVPYPNGVRQDAEAQPMAL